MQYIIRDHDRDRFEARKQRLQSLVDELNAQYPNRVSLTLRDQYYNMLEQIQPNMHIVELAIEAMHACEVTPKVKAIRGGTDGARLSFMGLPCPNLFAGGHNFHGKYEFLPVRSLQKSMETIVKMVEIAASRTY